MKVEQSTDFSAKINTEGHPHILFRTKKDILEFGFPYKERRTKKDAVGGVQLVLLVD